MIVIRVKDAFYQYSAYHITKEFYPNEIIKNELIDMGTVDKSAVLLFCVDNEIKFGIYEEQCGELPDASDVDGRKECKHAVNVLLYENLVKLTGKSQEWGILTGIRPTKVAMKRLQTTGGTKTSVMEWLRDYYKMSQKKANLAAEIAESESKLIEQLDLIHGYSLYIGIPFCKTRCSYCSFTAYPLDKWVDRIDEYLDALCKELQFVGKQSRGRKKLNTIYIGGGTPTSLTPVQLDRLLNCVEENFSYDDLQEITVEAGRPDSITREKLEVMRQHNVGRISINPQTMQDKTLKLIGREHTVQDIYEVYETARELGFENINMDLIVGLPGETVEDVKDTLQAVAKLYPDNLTVHSLAMKRTSQMTKSGMEIKEDNQMSEMIDLAAEYAKKMNLEPYYLYRQKNMAGNFENVGYAKVDKAGIYNILIMEEKQSIVAVGAGASTKIVLPREKDNIIRIENVKDVNEYITRIDEMIARKGEWIWH